MVIFGSSLGAQDQHIVDAINSGSDREIAISVRDEGSQRDLDRRRAELASMFDERHRVVFFDAATHPLGRPQLNVR